jgi:LPS O-antigen subunit length determinant protein (WzzB/FepE family)
MNKKEDEVELIDYLNVLWKRKWLIIISTFLCVVFAVSISFLLPEKWRVNAILLPSKFFVETEQGKFEEVVIVDPIQIVGQINQNSYDQVIATQLNIDTKTFPKMEAANLRDTNLVSISLVESDVELAKSILRSLFAMLKSELDKKIDVEVKNIDTQIFDIKTEIKQKEMDIQSNEIEKAKIAQETLSSQNKLKISNERFQNITDEMKVVKERMGELEKQQITALTGEKESTDALSILLYSNETQQNLRYYNILDEKLSLEKITQENLKLTVKSNNQEIKQLNTDIEKLKSQIENKENEIAFLKEKKARIDYSRLVKEPTASLNPVSPRRILFVLVAFVLGIFIFTVLAFLLDYLEKHRNLTTD